MSNVSSCPKCGAPLRARVPAGLCLACLLDAGLAAEAEEIGPYELLEQIGEGGCGVVYQAEQRQPIRRQVALKVIKLGMDTRQVLARFEAERQALALMDHPHIAKVFDAGTTESGRPYFVMELIRGIPVTRYCDEHQCDTRQRLHLFIQVCQAVQHAHQKGIIHRDLKPSNILVADHDGVAVPKIIDFGIAKATSGQSLTDKTIFTALEQFIGTPAYMSPEQAKLSGLDIDTRSDIYSLGVLLYELLTGKTPFDARELKEAGYDEVRRIIREVDPPKPSDRLSTLVAAEQTNLASQRQSDPPKLLGSIRGDLDWIVMKTLEKDRSRRYETANGLAADVNRHLKSEPVVARPPSTLYRLRKMVVRNKVACGTAVALAATILLGFAASVWQAVRATRAEAVTRQSLASMRMRSAEDYFADNTPIALAYLARVLEDNPHNHLAAERLLSALTYRSFATQQTPPLKHDGKVNTVRFSPDGTLVVTASDDKTAQIWNAASGVRVGDPFLHTQAVIGAEFSPDGKLILTASTDGTAAIWRLGDTNSLRLRHSTNALTVAHFSPNGKLVATAANDGTVAIWDVATAQRLFLLLDHAGTITAEAFSPDGKYLLTGSGDCCARLWDLKSGRLAYPRLQHDHYVKGVCFAPDSLRFVTACWDHITYVWDTRTGKLLKTNDAHTAVPFDVQFSSDGHHVLTAGKDTSLKLWNPDTGETNSFRLKTPVNTCAFSRDGNWFAGGTVRGTVGLYFTASGQPVCEPISHPDSVVWVEPSPDGARLATACADGAARIWNIPRQPWRGVVLQNGTPGQLTPVKDAVFDTSATKILTGCTDGSVRLWDAHGGNLLSEVGNCTGMVTSVRFSLNGRFMAATASDTGDGRDGCAKIWDSRSGRQVGKSFVYERGPSEINTAVSDLEFSPDNRRFLLVGHGAFPLRLFELSDSDYVLRDKLDLAVAQSVAFAPDGRNFATASDGYFAQIYDIERKHDPIPLPHREKISAVRFSRNGEAVATASWDGAARVWDAATGRPKTPRLNHDGALMDVEFSPDGSKVITSSIDATARIWSTQDGLALTDPLRHKGYVVGGEFDPDGRLVVTASRDGSARLWDVQTGLPVSESLRHDGAVNIAHFSPDGQVLLTASDDGSARLWPVPQVTQPAPKWFIDLAETLAGQRLDAEDHFELVDTSRLFEIGELCRSNSGSDFFSRWGRWFFNKQETTDPWNFPP